MKKNIQLFLQYSALTLFFACIAVQKAEAATESLDPSKLICHSFVRLTEQQAQIPTQLLESIALVESAKWYAPVKRTIAWPWTVMAEGRGRYFNTKQEAINEVRSLKARGIKNIDVGCMQINLQHHPKAFNSLEEAFDPQTNVRYSAKFLLDLRSRFGSWSNAVGYYHSATPEFHFKYRQKVLAKWQEARREIPNGVANTPVYNTAYNAPVYAPAARPAYNSVQRPRYYPAARQTPLQMRSQIMQQRRNGHLKVITF